MAHLPEWAHVTGVTPAPRPEPREVSPDEVRQRDELIALLKEHRGNISSMARAMGKARMQVQRWLKRHGLDPQAYR